MARRTVLLVALWAAAVTLNRSLVRVAGESMLPTLWPGDIVVTVPARLVPRRAGQIVVARDPRAPGAPGWIKRVHAIEPDGVELRGDNAAVSTDSRSMGRLPSEGVRRVVLARIWSDRRPGAPARPWQGAARTGVPSRQET